MLANFGEYCAALMSPEIIFLHVTIDNVSTGYLEVNFMKKIQKISTLWGITYDRNSSFLGKNRDFCQNR